MLYYILTLCHFWCSWALLLSISFISLGLLGLTQVPPSSGLPGATWRSQAMWQVSFVFPYTCPSHSKGLYSINAVLFMQLLPWLFCELDKLPEEVKLMISQGQLCLDVYSGGEFHGHLLSILLRCVSFQVDLVWKRHLTWGKVLFVCNWNFLHHDTIYLFEGNDSLW